MFVFFVETTTIIILFLLLIKEKVRRRKWERSFKNLEMDMNGKKGQWKDLEGRYIEEIKRLGSLTDPEGVTFEQLNLGNKFSYAGDIYLVHVLVRDTDKPCAHAIRESNNQNVVLYKDFFELHGKECYLVDKTTSCIIKPKELTRKSMLKNII